MNEEKKLIALTIKLELAEELLKYLATRPLGEVLQLFNKLQASEQVFEQVKE